MELKFAYLCGLVLVVACGDSRPSPIPTTPTSPVPVTPTPACPPCPAPGAHALSGVVRVGGVPVVNATVGLIQLGPQTPISAGPQDVIASRLTDEKGSYNFPSVENVSFSGALVSASKAEYLTDTKYILMSQDRQLDFDLERVASNNISVGQVVLGQIGEARCASFGYGGGGGAVCRRFALTIDVSGTLDVTVSSNPARPFDISVLRPDGTIGVNGSSSLSPLRVTLAVAAGLTYQIDVVHIDSATREFELRTILR